MICTSVRSVLFCLYFGSSAYIAGADRYYGKVIEGTDEDDTLIGTKKDDPIKGSDYLDGGEGC